MGGQQAHAVVYSLAHGGPAHAADTAAAGLRSAAGGAMQSWGAARPIQGLQNHKGGGSARAAQRV
eukprot:CAMPEP_0181246620 /NCGR_PEP_ID=MMETSP1096-20121128/44103_1 /TAXON_ID=156174 ORGANISM="Chrysochromulina ericina, Strain CCMP281" /NCGR_SAMPLE_ID=MMETSP1096 /ASSEMBLY_ACC=CAM_ASM_000453 /LENGTH=64 /DNA_ID=CAMNT_0023343473 /DNA_START=56 /DNA_END=250 /DNA_ORIENTATION=+